MDYFICSICQRVQLLLRYETDIEIKWIPRVERVETNLIAALNMNCMATFYDT